MSGKFSPLESYPKLPSRAKNTALPTDANGAEFRHIRGMPSHPSSTSAYPRQPNLKVVVPLIGSSSDSSPDELIDIKSSSKSTLDKFSDTVITSPVLRDLTNDTKPASRKRPLVVSPKKLDKPVKRRRVQGGSASLDIVNDVDDAELPRNFRFIDEYVFREGTGRLPKEAWIGCDCKPNMGRNVGCEYVQNCDCLQDSATDKSGRRIGFPYHVEGNQAGCLQGKYLKTRYAIYECNNLCGCGPNCRNMVVSKGRRIPLEIFRTIDRGWGLRSTKAILKGQFIDTYRGEVITDAEAIRRENESLYLTKDSFLFTLDKFQEYFDSDSKCFVVDGQFMGGPARFINHSCEPNCDVFAVSNVRGDFRVYELALFALDDIPAGTELTFDYIGDHDDLVASHAEVKKAKAIRNGKLATKCLCQSEHCRGYLWL